MVNLKGSDYMAVSGIGGSMPVVTFRQINVQLGQIGSNVVSSKMDDARASVSNFGNEPQIGNGQFTQISKQIEDEAVNSVSRIMEQDDDFEASNLGNDSAFGTSGFQSMNDTSFNPAMQRAASSYSYFNQ